MKKKSVLKNLFYFLLITTFSCQTKDVNYINYYQRVNEIDSIYRLANQPEIAAKKFKYLFRKYEPKNQDKIEEYATYLILADRYNMNFGGRKSLRKLIHLLAPGADHSWHKLYYPLFQKYGMDSLEVEKEIATWKGGLNKELIDSFSIAMERDQLPRLDIVDYKQMKINDNKNFLLLKWTFENYGYPSTQKIGIRGNDKRDIHLSTILLHLYEVEEYDYLKSKLLEYVKSGDCPPEDYAGMLDRKEFFNKRNTLYLKYASVNDTIDTLRINKNRKELGIPSIIHDVRIRQDFWKKKRVFQ